MKVLVELILGHRASVREGKTPEGYTHDWEVYVRSDQGNLQCFVERVIFHLHESFPKPKRVVKEPPYILKESGYAGFNLLIEIVFRNKDEPRNASFRYDLFLQSEGPPISHFRKEKLIFNFPSEEFAKKLFKGGGVLQDKDGTSVAKSEKQHTYVGNAPHSQNQQIIPGGGKSSKHAISSTNPTSSKSSPKNSFETLFGTPIKRSSGSLQQSKSASSSSTVSSNQTSASSLKSVKDRTSADNIKGIGGKGEKILTVKLEKPLKYQKSPALPEPSPEPSKPDFKPSKSKSKSSGEKKDKEKPPKKMPPPTNTSVPKKAKKSDIFDNSPSNSNGADSATSSTSTKPEKVKRRNSGSSKSKSKSSSSIDSNSKEKVESIIKKVKTVSKQPLSPISSTSGSSSSVCSPSASNSEPEQEEHNDEELENESESDLMEEPSSCFRSNSIPLTPSPTPISSSSSRKRARNSESQSPISNVTSPASSSSSVASAHIGSTAHVPPTKRRKDSSSSSVMTPETPPSFNKRTTTNSNSNNEVSNSSNVKVSSKTSSEKKSKHSKSSKGKRSSSSHKSSSKKSAHEHREKTRSHSPNGSSTVGKSKHSKKSKKKKKKSKKSEKMFDESNSECLSDSSNSEASPPGSLSPSPSPVSGCSTNGNGESSTSTSNTVGSNSSFSHSAVAGNITAEMKLLKDLHARIATIEDPDKLQEIVEIVEGCGREMWTCDSGVTFDFDLCKLNSTAIKRLQQAILL